MSINYAHLGTQMKSVIKMLGVPVTVSRPAQFDAKVLSAYMVFSHSTEKEDSSSPLSQIANATNPSATAYLGGSFAKPPEVGDKVISKNRPSYLVTSVETYKPGAIVVGYKLELA